ncbi:hypothetical protein [Leifsonia sp. C5G2]|uniref:ParB family protein n=1 Tax=Leifsonia sp. C5G2 TaxID=2735269 RepID=UPI00158579CA|nr:hypothetical protein [Leifsonia sp. C5G2]NUU08415.1 hypothetical protein [Leifsonia sp. C5G2]
MNRPAPRKSSLAGSSPITPPAAAPAAVDATGWTREQHEDADQVEQTRRDQEAERAAAKPAPREPKSRAKVSFYQDPADTDRVRGAILYTMTTEGSRNLSQFIHKAVMAEVERLEAKYNNGQPFPPVGARELPQGAAAANL